MQKQNLDILRTLERLDFLHIRSSKKQNLNFIGAFKQLNYLYLSGAFEDLSPIAECTALSTLILNCTIDKLNFIVKLSKLAYLAIDSCSLNCTLDALANSSVSMLRLSSVRKLTSIFELENMDNLNFLHLSSSKIEQLCNFSSIKNLKQLELYSMSSLKEIDPLWTAEQLEVLELRELNKGISALKHYME